MKKEAVAEELLRIRKNPPISNPNPITCRELVHLFETFNGVKDLRVAVRNPIEWGKTVAKANMISLWTEGTPRGTADKRKASNEYQWLRLLLKLPKVEKLPFLFEILLDFVETFAFDATEPLVEFIVKYYKDRGGVDKIINLLERYVNPETHNPSSELATLTENLDPALENPSHESSHESPDATSGNFKSVEKDKPSATPQDPDSATNNSDNNPRRQKRRRANSLETGESFAGARSPQLQQQSNMDYEEPDPRESATAADNCNNPRGPKHSRETAFPSVRIIGEGSGFTPPPVQPEVGPPSHSNFPSRSLDSYSSPSTLSRTSYPSGAQQPSPLPPPTWPPMAQLMTSEQSAAFDIPQAPAQTDFHWPSQQVYIRFPVTIPYDSEIFICVQEGDIPKIGLLLSHGASLDVVDPYDLGLLYYGAYYCWRNRGIEAAMAVCRALVGAGACTKWVDDIGNTPVETMADAVLVEAAKNDRDPSTSLLEVGRIFGVSIEDIQGYYASHGFPLLHQVLLRIDRRHGSLEDYLHQVRTQGTISDIINATDFRRRSALAWAIGHGWVEATAILLEFGADVQHPGHGCLPVLHQALAGPVCGRLGEGFMSIIRMLLSAGADANAADWEGWTPLHIAASWNARQAVNILSAYEINWTAVTKDGKSAVELAEGDPELVKFLGNFVH